MPWRLAARAPRSSNGTPTCRGSTCSWRRLGSPGRSSIAPAARCGMPSLRELQLDFGRALLGGAGERASGAIVDAGLPTGARLAIYRHHVFATLTGALRAVYPVVCRLVDERFFAYAADQFVRRHPPTGPCLVEYGSELPDFLASFPPCRHLAYLPDVARLEWAIHAASHAADAVPLAPTSLADIDPARVGDLVFRFDLSTALVASLWPVETIWRAH